jgi:hypothetical protein
VKYCRSKGTNLIIAIVVVSLDGLDQLGEGGLVFLGHLRDGKCGSCLLVNDSSKTGLALNPYVRQVTD